MLVLKIIVEAKPLRREVLADHRHREIATGFPAHFLRQRKPEMSGRVRAPARFGQQRFPICAGQPARIPVRAGVFAAMIKEADVVVGHL